MFEYVEDKKYLSRVRSVCGEIMQDFCHTLKEDYDIGSTFRLVGSGAKNLIVQNASQSIDLDYNLEIVRCEDFDDCRKLKECARKAFNKALYMNGWGSCEDSTSSLTTNCRISQKRANPHAYVLPQTARQRDSEKQTAERGKSL